MVLPQLLLPSQLLPVSLVVIATTVSFSLRPSFPSDQMYPFLDPSLVPYQSPPATTFFTGKFCLGVGVIGSGAGAPPSSYFHWSYLMSVPCTPLPPGFLFAPNLVPPLPLSPFITLCNPAVLVFCCWFLWDLLKPGFIAVGVRPLISLVAALSLVLHLARSPAITLGYCLRR